MRKEKEQWNDNEFNRLIEDLVNDDRVKAMAEFRHHADITCLDHSMHVAKVAYKWSKFMGFDCEKVVRAALLHDLFLYDWRNYDRPKGEWLHGFEHPKKALVNARMVTELCEVQEDIILKHMWPLTLKFPKYKESWLVTMADKYCATSEYITQIRWYAYLKRRVISFVK